MKHRVTFGAHPAQSPRTPSERHTRVATEAMAVCAAPGLRSACRMVLTTSAGLQTKIPRAPEIPPAKARCAKEMSLADATEPVRDRSTGL